MRTRASTAHQEAVTRRLELLRAGPDPGGYDDADPDWWSGHTLVPDDLDVELNLGRAVDPVVDRVVDPVVSALPMPGRHAARRGTPIEAWIPAPLRGRIGLGPWHLVVIAVLGSGALALTCVLLLSRRSSAVASRAPAVRSASPLVPLSVTPAGGAGAGPASPASPAVGVSTAGAGGSTPAMVTVDVEGKVRRPGIVIVPAGSRVTDALEAAGGVRRREALRGINLAAVLTDGQQIMSAPGVTPAVATGATTSAGASPAGGAPVNLNTATAEQLDTLPDVGPVTAQSIIEWREENGGFTSVQELLEVDGIGPATMQKLAPHVTV
jgi:competence protein ComEA